MRRLLILCSALALSLPLLPAVRSADADAVRTVDVKGVKFEGPAGKVSEPAAILKAEELGTFVKDKDQLEKLTRGVDFSKSKLLLFRWAGSGRDQLIAASDKGEVVFAYTRGLTRDLRQHALLFVVPKDAKFVVKDGR